MFSYLLPIPSPPLIWASGNSGFRNSVVWSVLSCTSAFSVWNRSKMKYDVPRRGI